MKELPLLQEMHPELRKGKWTREEEEYASKLILYFSLGLLRVEQGVTLRAFLSEKLHCDPMRITKKYTGNDCIGKQVFLSRVHDEKIVKKCESELKKLEKVFIQRLLNKSKERARVTGKRSLPAAKNEEVGGKSSKEEVDLPHTDSKFLSSVLDAPLNNVAVAENTSKVLPLPTFPSMIPAARGEKKGSYKRINSAPDLASLEMFEGFDQNDDGMTHAKKKRKKGQSIPRSRSTLSFDSFAEIDDRAAGELLLSFSETLRDNYVRLQEDSTNHIKGKGKKARALNSLPAFFSPEAISCEAAKYNKKSVKAAQNLSILGNVTTPSVPDESIFTHIGLNSADNNNFSVLEERVPFSNERIMSGDIIPSSDDCNETVSDGSNDRSSVDIAHLHNVNSSQRIVSDIGMKGESTVDEPEFFIGTGTDIE